MTTLIINVFFSISASAYDLEADGIYYTIISDKTKTVEVSKNKVKLYTGKVSIPSSITKFGETFTVTRIGLSCFRDCDKIYCINLPETIDSICNDAFVYCSALKEINIDKNNPYFQSVDGVVFNKDLTSLLHFPNAKTDTYEIPDGVKNIAVNSFTTNDVLRSLSMPSSLLKIEYYAFDCPNLIDIQLSKSLESIGKYSFSNCPFTSIRLPESLKSIEESAFYNCKNLSTIYIPKNVEYISEDWQFPGCSALEKIDVDPDNKYYTSIDGILYDKQISKVIRCPQNIKDMEWITLPSTITKICKCAFHSVYSLTRIVIPANVTIIGNGAFVCCDNLSRVYCYAENPPSTPIEEYSSSDPWDQTSKSTATLYVPKGCTDIYKNFYNKTYWHTTVYPYKNFKEIIEMDDDTGITPSFIDNNDQIFSTYNTMGVKKSTTTNGLNIIKYRNGNTKKIIK